MVCPCGTDLICCFLENLQSVRLVFWEEKVGENRTCLHQFMLAGRWTYEQILPSFWLSLRPLEPSDPPPPHTHLCSNPPGHAGFCALPLTPVPGPLPVLFPLRGALPLYTLTYPTSSASQMLSSLEGPPPSHAHTIDPSPAPPAHCFPLPCSSVLPVGLIIHWFYFFLFMYVSLSE